MFTPEQRARVRADLLEYGANDNRISGAAITGSAAAESEDKWSDIDLAFGVADAADQPAVVSEWTSYMYEKQLALHHLDVTAGAWIYRVFLLPGTLQVDLAFVHASEFMPLAPTFRLISGIANEPRSFPHRLPTALLALAGCTLFTLAVASQECVYGKRNTWSAGSGTTPWR